MIATRGNSGPLREYDPFRVVSVEEYEPHIGRESVEQLKRLAEPLAGRRWVHINSTFVGGGVAEMLTSLVPLARGLGVDTRWYAIPGEPDFFKITKTFHNLLQGMETPLPVEGMFRAYLETSRRGAVGVSIGADLVEIHDPQPLATILSGELSGPALWRCHIDTSAPHPVLWNLMLPYLNRCQGAVFTMPEFVGPGLRVPLHHVTPAIDPRAEKNHQYSDEEALSILGNLFREHGIDSERPILAAVSRYDVHKNQATILRAFKRLREESNRDPKPYLIFLGNTASDDPEGEMMLASLREQAGDDPDVRFWVNVPDNDRVVGALMRLARGMIHVSTKEGFGLVVAEALWQGTPVIGSRVGGIKEQVIDGQTGYLVDALDVEGIAERMSRLLERPAEAVLLGAQGKEYVRSRFLLPTLLGRYLALMQLYSLQTANAPLHTLDGIVRDAAAKAARKQFPAVAAGALSRCWKGAMQILNPRPRLRLRPSPAETSVEAGGLPRPN